MMLKTFAFLFIIAVSAALPLDENQDVGDIPPPTQEQVELKPEDSDLKTDSSFWGGFHGYYRYPIHRRSFVYPTYPVYRHAPSFYYYQTYPTVWNPYW